MKAREPEKVKLVVSVFTADLSQLPAVFAGLTEKYGPLDMLSGPMDFTSTDYYEEEFGTGLKRKIASFERLIRIDELSSIKLFTNGLEARFSEGHKRRVNIDPGYMALEKFVLASCKNFSHKIFIGEGVYADLTLMYVGTGFKDLEWSYPDYRGERIKALLKQARRRYAFQIGKGLKNG